MRLDHLAIAAETLQEGVAWAEEKLGVRFQPGGAHAHFGTHNKLLGLAGGIYLEVIACDPDGKSSDPRWFDLDAVTGPPRLANWICEPEDFETFLRYGMEKVPMTRGDLRWDMGVPRDGSLPLGGGFPTVLRWHTDTPPGSRLAPSGCALKTLTIRHPDAGYIQAELSDVLHDDRVVFETASEANLIAWFETPNGDVML